MPRGRDDQLRFVAGQGEAMHVGDRLALRVERHRFAAGRAVEPHAGDAAGQHPAQADVAGGDRIVAIDHPGELDVLAVLADLHVADVQADELLLVDVLSVAWVSTIVTPRSPLVPTASRVPSGERARCRGQRPTSIRAVTFLFAKIKHGHFGVGGAARHRPCCRPGDGDAVRLIADVDRGAAWQLFARDFQQRSPRPNSGR